MCAADGDGRWGKVPRAPSDGVVMRFPGVGSRLLGVGCPRIVATTSGMEYFRRNRPGLRRPRAEKYHIRPQKWSRSAKYCSTARADASDRFSWTWAVRGLLRWPRECGGSGDILRTAPFPLIILLKKVPLQLWKLIARIAPPLILHISQVESIQEIASFPTVVSAGSESPPLQR